MPGFNIPLDGDCSDSTSGRPTAIDPGYRTPGHLVETARQHRFRFSVAFSAAAATTPNSGPLSAGGAFDFWPKKITRPSVEIDEITIHNAQDEIFRPGKQHHQPVEIDFYETVTDLPLFGAGIAWNQSARTLFDWWRNQTLDYDNSLIKHPTFLDNSVNIAQLSGTGADLWNYYLYRCWPQKVSPQNLDYAESSICQTTVRLRYDKVDEKLVSGRF